MGWDVSLGPTDCNGHCIAAGHVVIQESGGVETGRTNYFEVFPIIYQQFTGFGQPEKVKERVVIAYGFSEPG